MKTPTMKAKKARIASSTDQHGRESLWNLVTLPRSENQPCRRISAKKECVRLTKRHPGTSPSLRRRTFQLARSMEWNGVARIRIQIID